MCILFMLHGAKNSKYKLIIASNRDEYLSRPTLPAEFQEDIICGRDLLHNQSGTWLGFHRNGKFATLTNYLVEKVDTTKKSRGMIVTNYLRSELPADEYCKNLNKYEYGGFNLIAGDINKPGKDVNAFYISNKECTDLLKMAPGINVLASTRLNKTWKKVTRGKVLFENVLSQVDELNEEQLMTKLFESVLSDKTVLYPDPLVKEQSHERCPKEFLYRYCSIQLSDIPGYGTGVQTVILVDNDNHVSYFERTLDIEEADKGAFDVWHPVLKHQF